MIDYLELVEDFHKKYNHYLGDLHMLTPNETIDLRKKLIEEETIEFINASLKMTFLGFERLSKKTEYSIHMTEIADALADLLYVVFGAALAYGIPIEEVFKEVHRSNMTKSMLKDEKSIKGKTIKGEDYDPPRIKEIIERHMK